MFDKNKMNQLYRWGALGSGCTPQQAYMFESMQAAHIKMDAIQKMGKKRHF